MEGMAEILAVTFPFFALVLAGYLAGFALARAADSIGETDEFARCLDLLDDCDPAARVELGLV